MSRQSSCQDAEPHSGAKEGERGRQAKSTEAMHTNANAHTVQEVLRRPSQRTQKFGQTDTNRFTPYPSHAGTANRVAHTHARTQTHIPSKRCSADPLSVPNSSDKLPLCSLLRTRVALWPPPVSPPSSPSFACCGSRSGLRGEDVDSADADSCGVPLSSSSGSWEPACVRPRREHKGSEMFGLQ